MLLLKHTVTNNQ